MGLMDLRGEAVIDAIADIIPAIIEIAEDKDVLTFLEDSRNKIKQAGSEDAAEKQLKTDVMKAIPALLKAHKHAVITIAAVFKGVSPEEYIEQLSIATLFADVAVIINDQSLVQLFLSQLSAMGVKLSDEQKEPTAAQSALKLS